MTPRQHAAAAGRALRELDRAGWRKPWMGDAGVRWTVARNNLLAVIEILGYELQENYTVKKA